MIKELTVISGKGGTGKTSLVAAFAGLQEDTVTADCDVDAANLHLLLEPSIQHQEEFRAGFTARIDGARCTGCGECLELCQFDALVEQAPEKGKATFAIDPIACEGCGVCAHFCPEEAILLDERVSGEWYRSRARYGPMVHARLNIAAENSGKLVTRIRTEARALAEQRGLSLILVDGSPGIGCPVIASITGCDMVLAVTEPTQSGLHDLERVASLAGHFKVPVAVVINKWDLNENMTHAIEVFCIRKGYVVAGRIPYSDIFTQAMMEKKTVLEKGDAGVIDAVLSTWDEVKRLMTEL